MSWTWWVESRLGRRSQERWRNRRVREPRPVERRESLTVRAAERLRTRIRWGQEILQLLRYAGAGPVLSAVVVHLAAGALPLVFMVAVSLAVNDVVRPAGTSGP